MTLTSDVNTDGSTWACAPACLPGMSKHLMFLPPPAVARVTAVCESGMVNVNRWKQDAAKMVRHMRYCTNMEKGDPNMADIATNCKKEVRCTQGSFLLL